MIHNDLFDKFKNPDWRLENLYCIVDKNAKAVKFKPNKIQKLINKVKSKKRIILKSRQVGVTTQEILKLLDYVLFNRNVTACIIAHESDSIKKIFKVARYAYKTMPEQLKPQIDRGGGSKYEMYFPKINSKIYCDLESRGDTINRLHISEGAFVDGDRFISTTQAVPLDGEITIESTANGINNYFYDIWQESNYEKIFLPWFFHDEYQIVCRGINYTKDERDFIAKVERTFGLKLNKYQLKFRREKQAELKSSFSQEYPEDDKTCFIFSGRSVTNQEIIASLVSDAKAPLKDVIQDVDGEDLSDLVVFQTPEAKRNYIVGCDVSLGVGGDFSVATVLCLETLEEVAFYRAQISPFALADKLVAICKYFTVNDRLPILAVESNNHGFSVLMRLSESKRYKHLYRKEDSDFYGWYTNSVNRPLMLNDLIESVQNRFLKLNSKTTLTELGQLVEIKNKVQAPYGKDGKKLFDDCVIASAIAWQVLKEVKGKFHLYKDLEKSLYV